VEVRRRPLTIISYKVIKETSNSVWYEIQDNNLKGGIQIKCRKKGSYYQQWFKSFRLAKKFCLDMYNEEIKKLKIQRTFTKNLTEKAPVNIPR
jgi:hypothetical protein